MQSVDLKETRLPSDELRPGNGATNMVGHDRTLCPFEDEWIQAWAESFLGQRGWSGPISYHYAGDLSSGARATAAFARQMIGPVRVAALAGYYWPYRGVGMIGDAVSDHVARQLANVVANDRPGTAIRLGPIVADDHCTYAFIVALKRRGWRGLRRSGGVVFRLSLPVGVSELHAGISSSLLKNLAYLRRRLDKQHGPVSAERFVLRLDDKLPELMQRLARIETASWVAGEGGEPKFVGPSNQRFWTRLARGSGPSWRPVVWVLRLGATDAAFSLHLETADTIWIVANSYDASWKSHSPGSLLTLDVLRHATSNGYRLVDWGQGDSGYKSRWGACPGPTIDDYLMFAPGVAGFSMHAAARLALRDWVTL